MSFSALKDIESCPLRWSLSHADYSDLWRGEGYPTKTNVSAIIGQVIHRAVETIVKGTNSLAEGSFQTRMTATIRDIGGLTALIELSLSEVLDDYYENPRMVGLLDQYRTGRSVLPSTVRTCLQTLLQKVSGMRPVIQDGDFERADEDDRVTKALPYGLYTEITLYARNTNWLGKIDILSIGPTDITIEDIKTGKAKDADREQLLTYAWLWWCDDKRNPNRRLPTHLRVRYLESSVEVPVLNESELIKFERELIDRTARAVATIDKELSEARPSSEICRFCEVRQLCDVYWDDVVTSGRAGIGHHGDVDAELIRVLSRKTWQIEVGAGSSFASGTKALLRGPLPENPARHGSTLRILNAMFVEPTGDQSPDEMPVVQLLAQSELFVRPLSTDAA